jgi:uncharacterized protein (DUF608 family)
MIPDSPDCPERGCNCRPDLVDRRTALTVAGLGLAGLFPPHEAVAGPFADADFDRLIPADKKLRPAWLASLTARGEPETYSGNDLRFIGMPVGGICAGTLYLGGDGKLWLWNIFNRDVEGVVPKVATYAGKRLGARDGANYVDPPQQQGPVDQGFALSLKTATGEKTVNLDRTGFRNVTFLGQYPVGTVTYQDPDLPVLVKLEAFSPFIPLDADDSGLPATVLSFTVKNEGKAPLQATLAGWLENAVCLHHRQRSGARLNRIRDEKGFTFLDCSARPPEKPKKAGTRDIVFEDWRKETYAGWKVEGKAFGTGPVEKKHIPAYQGDVGGGTGRVVNSHATAPGNGVAEKDGQTGKLTSKPFRIDRDFVNFWIGGGAHQGKTCLNLLVGGKVVRSAAGQNNNKMQQASFDVRPYRGKDATIEIVDAVAGGWGNVGVGQITFSDRPAAEGELSTLFDFGTMGLALLGAPAEHRRAGCEKAGFGGKNADEADRPLEDRLAGSLGRKLSLKPGESATVHFVVCWHFPNLDLKGVLKGRYYARRFDSSLAVARHVSGHFDRLSSQTRLWRDTWYDSTLPHWFLNRTFANLSTLATTTCYRLKDGRFWAWEGVGCCEGTCTHVWHYAQAVARIFPEIERDQRERVDFGLALDSRTGVIHFRGEFGSTFAEDGQAGTILRAYREHQMSADDAFLKRIYPKVKKALQCLIDRDRDGAGILYGPMHNTLDADWFGVVPWLVGLYHAALRAGEEMALERGDGPFARKCRAVFDRGVPALDRMTWRKEYGYFVHVGDPKHRSEVGSYDGSHIDQVFGQGWAHQVGLGRVMDEQHTREALRSLWKYNFTPDVGPFRAVKKPGRWYAMPGEGGLVMVTFPFGKAKDVKGGGAWTAMYFNECMSGFEWQAAGHMIWEGMAQEGLAVARMIHDRYHARRRNPYNEVECSDHYARAMASYGAFLAACGFTYHGPKGHMGFAPRVTPDDFRSAFTAAEGWGTFTQRRTKGGLAASIEVKRGKLGVRSLALEVAKSFKTDKVKLKAAGKSVAAKFTQDGTRLVLTFPEVRVGVGQKLEIEAVG